MLAELEEQLRQTDRLAVIGELTSSIVHEVRNPLGSIRGAAEIVADSGTSAEKRSEFSKILIEETERINGVLENYLSFARKKKQKESEYVIQGIIQNVVMMLGAQARKRSIEILSSMPDEPVYVLGDPNDLWQVSMNLILNAIQAIGEDGTVILRLDKDVSISVEKSSNRADPGGSERFISLSIKDTGPGIVKADQDKIFEPFYSTKANGSGLGLSIVKRIADSNNWILEVKSDMKSGTEFLLAIPVISS
jgi:signal transduction histidine kinase